MDKNATIIKDSSIEDIARHFTLPILYNPVHQKLDEHIVKDLELKESTDGLSMSIYDHFCNPSDCFSKQLLNFLPSYYTTDSKYLKDTQHILKTLEEIPNDSECFGQTFLTMYDEVKRDKSFRDKYCYLDWDHLVFLNKCDWFMQFMSLYNISSPLLSFFFPIILLIVPFFVIKAKGHDISIDEYTTVLKEVISNHAIGKVFTQFNSVDTQQKIYLLVSAGFYIFSVYQNALVCIRFYNNMYKIYDFLNNMLKYLNHSIAKMEYFLNTFSFLPSYQLFNGELKQKLEYLRLIRTKLLHVVEIDKFKLSLHSLKQIGYVMTEFYEFYDNPSYHAAIVYSFGFNGYMNVLNGLKRNINNKHISFCKFKRGNKSGSNKKENKMGNKLESKEEKNVSNKTAFKNAYYPALIGKKPVKNSLNMSRHLVITGPNASGKTTTLKTSLINVLVSQQFGCGCYSSATIQPYTYIHCYLNIPDTIGRDSLLQAEARRCKEIIDSVSREEKTKTHFCVFDELYSGTNPEEAIVSAYVVMEYLANKPNVTTVLTTHYVDLCKRLEKHKNIKNYRMKVEFTKSSTGLEENSYHPGGNDFKYTYLLEKGISDIKGGIKVLYDMKYPEEILSNSQSFV